MILVIILSVNAIYGGVYSMYITSWVSGIWCTMIGYCIQYMMFFRVHSVLVFQMKMFYTIAYPLRSHKHDKSGFTYSIAIFCWFIGVIANLFLSLLWNHYIQTSANTAFSNNLCLTFFDVRNVHEEPYKSLTIIFLIYVLLSFQM